VVSAKKVKSTAVPNQAMAGFIQVDCFLGCLSMWPPLRAGIVSGALGRGRQA
jgi:hypothetical protein